MANKILNKRSNAVTNGSPKLPTASQLDYGEIAINYAKDVETISIKNSNNEILAIQLRDGADALANLASHENNTTNPHNVTKAQVGLGNVDNTSDVNKPLSTAQSTAIAGKLNDAAHGGVVNNLTTNDSTKALSAAQGIVLLNKINEMTSGAAADLTALENRVTSVEEEINTATTYIDDTLAPKASTLLSQTI